MKHVARTILRLMTIGLPVFIAACYGAPYRYDRTGKVIDRDTHEPINGIRVNCLGETGLAEAETYSAEDGSFVLLMNQACATVTAEDVDGQEYGSYQTASMPYSEEGMLAIQMTRKP